MGNLPLKTYTPLEIARHDWKRTHKGALKQIAERLSYSQTLVSRVFNGHQSSFDRRIEEALCELDAPGFRQRKGTPK
jgi:hypothetical protein